MLWKTNLKHPIWFSFMILSKFYGSYIIKATRYEMSMYENLFSEYLLQLIHVDQFECIKYTFPSPFRSNNNVQVLNYLLFQFKSILTRYWWYLFTVRYSVIIWRKLLNYEKILIFYHVAFSYKSFMSYGIFQYIFYYILIDAIREDYWKWIWMFKIND